MIVVNPSVGLGMNDKRGYSPIGLCLFWHGGIEFDAQVCPGRPCVGCGSGDALRFGFVCVACLRSGSERALEREFEEACYAERRRRAARAAEESRDSRVPEVVVTIRREIKFVPRIRRSRLRKGL